MRPTIKYAEGGAERQDSVTNGLRQTDCLLSNAVGRLGNEQEAEHKEVHQVLQCQKEALDAKLTQELEHVACESDAKLETKGPSTIRGPEFRQYRQDQRSDKSCCFVDERYDERKVLAEW